jgi:hypothetical protein
MFDAQCIPPDGFLLAPDGCWTLALGNKQNVLAQANRSKITSTVNKLYVVSLKQCQQSWFKVRQCGKTLIQLSF